MTSTDVSTNASSNLQKSLRNVDCMHELEATLHCAQTHCQSKYSVGECMAAAYHHFGMISPFKVARDLTSNSSNGARKFFDEFMTWRELSYAFCFQHWPDLESTQVLHHWQSSFAMH